MTSVVVRTGNSSRAPRKDAVTVEFSHVRKLNLFESLSLADRGNSIFHADPISEEIAFAEWFEIAVAGHAFDQLHIPETLQSKYLRLIAESLALQENVPYSVLISEQLLLAERYPLHVKLEFAEHLSVAEHTASKFRSLVAETCKLKELGQVEMFLKVLQELRSGRVSKVRAERPVPDDEEAPKGSMTDVDSPPKRFADVERP